MKKYILLVFLLAFGFSSCELKEEIIDGPAKENDQTVFMYMPWSSNLTSYFRQNIADFETAIQEGILRNERVVVFFMSSATEASLFELQKNGNRRTFKTYLFENTNPAPYTTAETIASILEDVKRYAPAKRYAMTVSSHGMGWLPAPRSVSRQDGFKYHWDYAAEGVPLTRYFGGTTSQYQTDLTTLAEGIAAAGLKMEYILFDDCYMSTIEVAYDLREVTDYLIASPTEVMAYGFPYHKIGKHLVGTVDYGGIAEAFHSFYEDYEQMPCGTIGITYCPELENLAAIMKEINQGHEFDPSLRGSLQRLDGYTPVIFYDYGDYVAKLCTDPALLARFQNQLEKTVPSEWSLHTRTYYTMILPGQVTINAYSGITISDPSTHSQTGTKTETAWYEATH